MDCGGDFCRHRRLCRHREGKSAKSKFIVRLKGFAWTREDFCRGWLITGDTGSGKTRSGINQLLYQVFQNDRHWGGLCIDDKGVYWETLVEMAEISARERFNFFAGQAGQPAGKLEADTYIQFAFRPDHPTFHLRKIRRGHGDKFGAALRAIIFQKSGANSHRPGLELLTRMDMEVTLENVRNFLLEDDR